MERPDIERNVQTDANRDDMRRISRIFSAAFYICAIFPAIPLIVSLGSFTATLITLGTAGMDPLTVFSSILANGGLIAAYLWSYLKDKRGTIAAIAAVILWWLLYVHADPEGLIIVALVTVLQAVCFAQYKKLDYLKTQEGYPDFYNLSRSEGGKRIMSDEQIRESMKFYETDMGALEADGSKLKENSEKHTANTYMDELFTDGTDLTKGK